MAKGVVLGLVVGLVLATGCSNPGNSGERAGGSGRSGGAGGGDRVVVDVAIAEPGKDDAARTYTGNTGPVRQVALRSQTEGQLINLAVDVGDAVKPGQVLGQVDAAVLQAAVGQANAELAARQFEVAQAEAQLADARTLVEQAQAEYQLAASDAARLQALAGQGAISAQEAQRSQTTQQTALQAVRSAEQQVRTRQQAIATAQQRVAAQRALLEQSQARLSNSVLRAPLAGVVLSRTAAPGDFLQAGQAVLELGSFAEVEVEIQVSDRDRSNFSLGQAVQVKLDAFPGETLTGRVSRISPVANPASRLIPIEVTLPNPTGEIGSGLLARVTVSPNASQPISVPESALETSEEADNTLFVVAAAGDQATVQPRSVRLGERANGQVQILDGLKPGEAYVIRSSQPLQPGQTVERSLLSDS